MIRNITLTTLFAVLAISLAVGQIRTPAPSPSAKVHQTVGLTDVSIEYSRPSAKGRTIFAADGLVPYGKIWRTGANSISKITFSDDVTVGGKKLEAGSYGILTKPGASEWAVHFYSYDGGNWGSYVEKTPAAAVMVTPSKTSDMAETFTLSVDHVSMDGAHFVIAWENTKVAVPIEVNVDEQVMANIERVMAGPSTADYYAAGDYMFSAGKDLNKALMYVQKATKVDNPRFWQVRKEALILAELGRKADAIAAAKKSLALAKEAGNDDYIRMNEKSIKEWSM